MRVRVVEPAAHPGLQAGIDEKGGGRLDAPDGDELEEIEILDVMLDDRFGRRDLCAGVRVEVLEPLLDNCAPQRPDTAPVGEADLDTLADTLGSRCRRNTALCD